MVEVFNWRSVYKKRYVDEFLKVVAINCGKKKTLFAKYFCLTFISYLQNLVVIILSIYVSSRYDVYQLLSPWLINQLTILFS